MPGDHSDYAADEAQILGIIDSMYEAISWKDGTPPDFNRFIAPVRADATVVPSARPVAPTDINSFVKRMQGLHAGGTMRTFEEAGRKNIVKIFGNIAVALGSFEAAVNGDANRGVNAWLFVRDGGKWQIAAMAWDNESELRRLPSELE